MALLRPFKGLRPPKNLAEQVAAPPYDVVSSAEARAYAEGNPRCFFHVSRPEIDVEGTDEHAPEVYTRGLKNLQRFVADGTLKRDEHPRLYVYRQKMGNHTQTGVVAAASVAEYDGGKIKKHELTRADKEDDRTRHIDVLGANDEPVFLTYRAQHAIDDAVGEIVASPSEYDFASSDGVKHTFWLAPPALGQKVLELFKGVDALYIADGHHRSAAASRVHALRRGRPGSHDAFLAVIFPHDQMQILPYYRLVKDLFGHSVQSLLAKIGEKFVVTKGGGQRPAALHQFGLFIEGEWYLLTAREGSWLKTPVGELDVSILQTNLLGPLLGIGDPRVDKRIDFVGGIRGPEELERRVRSGSAQLGFTLFPTSLEQLIAIADANEIMPPKSTWFEPKLRSGLVLHEF
ncbi:MAG: DUF1015 family protein [Myxococcaceae bacterium]